MTKHPDPIKKKRRRFIKPRRYGKSRKLPVLISRDDPDCVYSFPEWCEINHISQRQGRRILKAPGGPIVTQLSAKRIGITRRNNRAWQASRERPRLVSQARALPALSRAEEARDLAFENALSGRGAASGRPLK